MTKLRIWFPASILLLSSLFAANVARAQRAATMAPAPRAPGVRARPAPARTAAWRPVARIRSAPIVRKRPRVSSNDFGALGGLSGGSFGAFNPGAVSSPCSGFNFLGPANQDWTIEAAIDPATQWRLFEGQRFNQNCGSAGAGFYLFDGGEYAYQAPPETEQPASDEQQAASEEQNEEQNQEAPPAGQQESQSASEGSAPLPDAGQFVLVLRNGSHIQAVAFTRADDRIIYVTTDGLRRALPLSDLDTDSTMRVNEGRGTPLQLPL